MSVVIKLSCMFVASMIIGVAHAESAALPQLDARFETTQCAVPCKSTVKRDWWMLRSPQQLEVRDVAVKTGQISQSNNLAKYGEIWRQASNGKLSYFYLMHDDKRAIEYAAVDLNMMGMKTDEAKWQIENQLVTDSELQSLQKSSAKSAPYHGMATEKYSGTVNGAKLNLVWIPQLRIPLQVAYVYPQRKVTIKLRELYKLDNEKSPIAKTTDEVLMDYQQLYYTDIGDMEQEASTQTWLANAKGAPGLQGHHH